MNQWSHCTSQPAEVEAVRTFFRNSVLCTFLFVPGSPSFPQGAAVVEAGGTARIVILIYDYADIGPEILGEAKREAGRIFQLEEIEIIWLERHRNLTEVEWEQRTQEGVAVSLRIVPRAMAQEYPVHRNPNAFGFAAVSPKQEFAVYATVFFHRVEEMARRQDVSPGNPRPSSAAILGHVMAHEIGHLLGCAHVSTGLMRKLWATAELTQIAQRKFSFAPGQGEWMRHQCGRKARRA